MSDATRAKELLGQLEQERIRGQGIKRMITLVVLGMFVAAGGTAYYKVSSFDTELFATELQTQASTKMWPLVSRELDSIATDAVPAITTALANEAGNLMPRISSALESESVIFNQHLQDKMKTSLDQHFKQAAEKHKDALKARFPQFSADQAVYDELIVRLSGAAQAWAHEELDTTFQAHIQVLQSINEQVQVLMAQSQEQRAEKGNVAADEVMILFLEIMNTRMGGEG